MTVFKQQFYRHFKDNCRIVRSLYSIEILITTEELESRRKIGINSIYEQVTNCIYKIWIK